MNHVACVQIDIEVLSEVTPNEKQNACEISNDHD